MTNKKISIIGAGVAGLCAGSYLQMNGYDTEIFEMNNIPGGLCTSWIRRDYTFDGSIHSIGMLNKKYMISRWWRELIDADNLKFHCHEDLVTYEDVSGNVIKFTSELVKLERDLKAIAPEDTKFIEDFVKAIKCLLKYDLHPSKPLELWNPIDYLLSQYKSSPYLFYLNKYKKPMCEITKDCKSSLLKKVLNQDFFSHFPAYFFILSIAELCNNNLCYPIGGSLQFARLIEKKYLDLGGKINYKCKVEKINVKNNEAVGITLTDGNIFNSDLVISAADGYNTIFKMLEKKYVNDKIINLYEQYPVWSSAIVISLGIARTFENETSAIELHLEKELVIDEHTKLKSIPITTYNFDPTLAPDGKTCMRIILHTENYEYWESLRENNHEKYKKEKERISNEVITILDKRFGNIIENVEVVDVATPATFNRYTNNWKGRFMTWDWVGLLPVPISKQLPKLKNFYMVGQWVMAGGGVPCGLITGRDTARIICHKARKKFKVQ